MKRGRCAGEVATGWEARRRPHCGTVEMHLGKKGSEGERRAGEARERGGEASLVPPILPSIAARPNSPFPPPLLAPPRLSASRLSEFAELPSTGQLPTPQLSALPPTPTRPFPLPLPRRTRARRRSRRPPTWVGHAGPHNRGHSISDSFISIKEGKSPKGD